MRPRRWLPSPVWALLALVACSGPLPPAAAPVPPAPELVDGAAAPEPGPSPAGRPPVVDPSSEGAGPLDGAAPWTGARPGGPVALPAEDCRNGQDDDGDGLLDCEDGDCIDALVCQELCENGLDDNLDGLIDGEDPVCWTLPPSAASAPTVHARVAGGGAWKRHETGFQKSGFFSGCLTWFTSISSSADVVLDSAYGTAWVTTSLASSPTTCTWQATDIRFSSARQEKWVQPFSMSTRTKVRDLRLGALSRGGSWVDSGCPVAASAFLPTGLRRSGDGHVGATSSGSWVGRRWYVAMEELFPATRTWQNGPGPLCHNAASRGRTSTWDGTLYAGSTVELSR